MATRSRTLRKLPPVTREYFRLVDNLESALTRLKNFRPKIRELELLARAEQKREFKQHAEDKPGAELDMTISTPGTGEGRMP
jgi:hypothetical protein